MVTRVKPEGWTDVQEFDWVGKKWGTQLSNMLACQVDKSLDNLALHNKQTEYKIELLQAKIDQIRSARKSMSDGNQREEVQIGKKKN